MMKRNLNGILLLDKPLNLTSNKALQITKHLFGAAKAGHTGSLDPLATGMLPLCFGEATKFSQVLLDSDKHYHLVAKLGVKTTTGDAEGEIIETRTCDFSAQDLMDTLEKFRGPILQVPPMHSALKHQGQPLYRLARKGINIDRPARSITIHQLEMIDCVEDVLTLDVHCSKGTYIRSLIEDIGAALGCGAHLIYLRRVNVGPYRGQKMISLETLQKQAQDSGRESLDQYLLPPWTAVQTWPQLILPEQDCSRLFKGQVITAPSSSTPGLVRLSSPQGDFLGIGEVLADLSLVSRRLMAFSPI